MLACACADHVGSLCACILSEQHNTSSIGTMAETEERRPFQSLLPEFLRLLTTHLSWSDTLSARATCSHWAAALDPLVTQLRVPLVAAPCFSIERTATCGPSASGATGCSTAEPSVVKSPQQLTAALSKFVNVRSVTLLLTPNTTGLDLQQALQAVGSKVSITSVELCEIGKPPAKDDKPRAYLSELKLTSLPHVITLKITTLSWSLPSIWKQVAALQNLPASRNADHSSAGGSSSIPHQAAGANSSAHSNSIRGGGGGYALRSLTIEHVPNTPVSKLALVGGPPKLPPLQLTHLTTPLPGQFDSAGAVVCALNAAHANYLFELAAGLPELVQLQVLGQYEGHEGVFERFDKLQELRCELGQAFRSYVMEAPLAPDNNPILRIINGVHNLTHFDILPRALSALETEVAALLPALHQLPMYDLCLLQYKPTLKHLAVPLYCSGTDVGDISGQLHSLTGQCGFPSDTLLDKVLSVASNMTSLILYQSDPNLTQRMVEGPQMAIRTMRTVQVPTPPSPLEHLHTLCLMADRGVTFAVTDPAAFWEQFPALRSLRLQNVGLGWGNRTGAISPDRAVQLVGEDWQIRARVGDRTVLWLQDLPCSQLQRLELGRYHVVISNRPHGSVKPAADGASSSGVGISSYGIAAAGTQQQQQQWSVASSAANLAALSVQEGLQSPGAAAADAQAGATNPGRSPSSSSTGTDLSGLHHLTLVDCGCLLLVTQEPIMAAASSSSSSSSTPHLVRPVSVQQLLLRLFNAASSSSSSGGSDGSSLRSLTMKSVPLSLLDIVAITGSPLGRQLEELVIQTQSWVGSIPAAGSTSDQPQQHPQQQYVPCSALPPDLTLSDVLATAARAGILQRLRRLSLCITEPPAPTGPSTRSHLEGPCFGGSRTKSCLGASVLASCYRFSNLQELQLVISAEEDKDTPKPKGSGWCSCRSSPGPIARLLRDSPTTPLPALAGPWQEVLRLRNLRVCDVTLQCYESRVVQPAQRGEHHRLAKRTAVVGPCRRCGGAVKASDLRAWLQSVAAAGLPGCQFDVDMQDRSSMPGLPF